jgi:hypothetical protein
MATANEKFKRDPVKFMQQNLVFPPSGSKHTTTSLVTLTKQNDCTCKTKIGSAWGKNLIDVYRLDFSTDQDNAFKVYWLPYDNNKQFHMVLGNESRFMFTPLMDGCTFAYGGRDPKSPIVAHSNFQNTDKQIDQAAINKELKTVYTPQMNAKLLQKDGYASSKHFGLGSGHVRVTTFGVFEDKIWKFYAQKWEDHHKAAARKGVLMDMTADTDPSYYGSNAYFAEMTSAGKTYELLSVCRL